MDTVTIIPTSTESEKRSFLRLPEQLYTNDPNWVCPLRIERRDFFDPKKNPFFDGAEVQLFLARRDGRDVGRISAHMYHAHNRVHNEQTGFFGFFNLNTIFKIISRHQTGKNAMVKMSAAPVWIEVKCWF